MTDRPMGMSAKLKASPATYAPVCASRVSRMPMYKAQAWHDAAILAASWCAGDCRASAMKA
ncbi:hypothetical protein D3C77_736650 [compost metagenome]